MLFSHIPPQYAPLGREARYGIYDFNSVGLNIRILNAATGLVIGTKKFTGVTEASFDAAPYLRRCIQFVPVTGGTGFHPAPGRTVSTIIRFTQNNGPDFSLPAQTFLPTTEKVQAPALLTSMPRQRIIAPRECDELTFFTAGACVVMITAQAGDTTTGESYREEGEGMHIFRIDMRDFAEAETLTVDAGPCGTIVYTIDRTPQRGKRLAWRTDAGSVEHYTFPVEKSETVEVVKKRAYGPAGHVASGVEIEVSTTLRSAFEVRNTLESLAELLSSPQGWLADGDKYTPVDVVSTTTIPHRHDAVGTLEIEIRPLHKTCSRWN